MSSELRGLRVLAVDLDSQQDLSRSMLRKKLKEQAGSAEVAEIGDHLARPFTDQEVQQYNNRVDEINSSRQPGGAQIPHANADDLGRTLKDALLPLMGDDPVVRPVVPEEVNPNLYLLSGSPTMEDLDRPMTISEGQLKQASLRNWQGAPLHVIKIAAKHVNADIILLDCNPSLSTINRNVIMSSDYVVITVRPEDFSRANVDTFINRMARNVHEPHMFGGSWLQQMVFTIRPEVNQEFMPANARYPLVNTFTKVLGCIMADYASTGNVETTRNPNNPDHQVSTSVLGVFHDQAATAIQAEMNTIETKVRGIMNRLSACEVTPPASHNARSPVTARLTIDNSVYENARLTPVLGRIRSYHSIGPLTHHAGVPAPFIRQEHCVDRHTGKALDALTGLLERAGDFRRWYDQFAWNVLKLMNDDPDGKLHNRLGFALQDHREVAGGPPNPETDTHPSVPNPVPGYRTPQP